MTKAHALWTAALLALVVAGCGDDETTLPEPDLGREEDAGADAGADGGMCFTGAMDSPLNGECNCQLDCVAGTSCEPERGVGGPRGVCGDVCTLGSDDCGPGARCEPVERLEGVGLCRQGCASDGDCRDGWACLYGSCAPFCTDDAQCLSGACDLHWNRCNPPPDPEGGGTFAPCSRHEDCLSVVCAAPIGGYCLSLCRPDGSGCPQGDECVVGLDPDDPTMGFCMPPCSTDADCPGDFACLDTGDGRRVCWLRA